MYVIEYIGEGCLVCCHNSSARRTLLLLTSSPRVMLLSTPVSHFALCARQSLYDKDAFFMLIFELGIELGDENFVGMWKSFVRDDAAFLAKC